MSLSITDAFQADQIAKAGVILDDEQDAELSAWLTSVVEEGGTLEHEDVINLCGLAFVAGRCFQSQFSTAETVAVDMDAHTLRAFLEFLVR